jgi:hypothetical protein
VRHHHGACKGNIGAIPWPEVAASGEALMAKKGGWRNCSGWLRVASRSGAARPEDEAHSGNDGGTRVWDMVAALVGGSVR